MLILVYIALGLMGLYLFLRSGKQKNGTVIPGPKGWPVVGLGLELTQRSMFFKLSQYAKQYGDIFKINVYGNTLVVLNSADFIRKAFNELPYKRVMNDRVTTFYGEEFLRGSQSIAFMKHAYGSKHHGLRKGFTKAMHAYGEGKKEFENMVHAELSRLVGQIETYGSEVFDIQDLINRSLENIISIVLIGHEVKTEEDFKALRAFGRLTEYFLSLRIDALMRMFPILRRLPTEYRSQYEELVNANDKLIKMFFYDQKATYTPGVTRGIVDFMIREQLQDTKDGDACLFSDDRIIAIVAETLVAGVMTSLCHLSSTFLILMNHPEYQTKIQSEIDRVIGRDRLPTLDDKVNCPFTEAFALETHRLISVLPGLVTHFCKSDLEFEGYYIPKNSVIVPNVFHVHHDEKIWDDPWEFRPERFLDDNGDILPNDHPLRKSWLGFGTGRRQCAGESFARSRVFLVVTRLLQRWSFEMKPESHMTYDLRTGADNFDINTVIRTKPLVCRAVPRTAAKEY